MDLDVSGDTRPMLSDHTLLYPSCSNCRTLLKLAKCALVSANILLEFLPIHGKSEGGGSFAVSREYIIETITNSNGIQTNGLDRRSMTAWEIILSNGAFSNCSSRWERKEPELDQEGITMMKLDVVAQLYQWR